MIVCRKCSRRHTDGTDFCVCGAFLEFDGQHVADDPSGGGPPAVGSAASSVPPPAPPAPPASATRSSAAPAGGWDAGSVARPSAPAPAPWSGFAAEPGPAEPSGGQVRAQLPDAQMAPAGADPVEVRPTARAGDVGCQRCGRANPPTRQFCQHCGQELVVGVGSTAPGPDHAGARGPSWWRRVTAKLRGRGIATDPNRLATEAHMLSRGGLSGRSMLFRSGGIALVLGGLLAFLGPWRGTVTAWARDQLGASRYELIDIQTDAIDSVATESAVEPLVFPMQEAAMAVDRHLNTSWATQWLDPVGTGVDALPADDGCQTDRRTDSLLRISFPEPTDLARISIIPGRYEGDAARTSFFRPRVVELRWNGDECRYLEVADVGELSQHDFEHADVEELEIRVVGVYADAESQPTVDIAEVVLERDR